MRNNYPAVELEVIRNALEGVADSMAITLYQTARSSGVRLGWDFSTAVLSPRGELIGQGLCHPIHLGGMMPALAGCLRHFPEGCDPGDVLITNDPYEGAQHLPDIYLFAPVHVSAGLVAYLGAICHHTDIGGRVPGGQGFDNTEIHQEGLRIPPLKFYQGGQPNETLLRLIEKAVRQPEHVLGDLQAQRTALATGARQLERLIATLGHERYEQLTTALVDYTERLTRAAIMALPDGRWSFTDYVDDDGCGGDPIAIVATVSKTADEIEVSFEGTSPMCAGSITGLMHMNESFVHMALRSLLGPDLPSTSGFFRPIKVLAPEGSFVNPTYPAAVGARQVGGRRINHAVWGALAQLAPERVFACPGGADAGMAISGVSGSGSAQDGGRTSWVLTEGFNETASGGRWDKDGLDGQGSNVTNQANTPVEILEREYPVRIHNYGLVADTEGPGQFRGGLALGREYEFLADDLQVRIRSDRRARQPWGVAGGGSSAPPLVTSTTNGIETSLPAKTTLRVASGTRIFTQWCGGGGWGAPLARDAEAVLADVIAGKVSPARAESVYGVILATRGRSVDVPATASKRDEIRRRVHAA